MKKQVVIGAVIVAALVAGTLGLIVYSASKSFSELCEVCVTFEGRSKCRQAYGQTREEAVRTATENACSFLASGMTESIRCSNTSPERVSCPPAP